MIRLSIRVDPIMKIFVTEMNHIHYCMFFPHLAGKMFSRVSFSRDFLIYCEQKTETGTSYREQIGFYRPIFSQIHFIIVLIFAYISEYTG